MSGMRRHDARGTTARATVRWVGAMALATASWACAPAEAPPAEAEVTPLPSPAASPSGEPSLTTDAAGQVHLTWLERRPDSTHALRLASLDGDAWGPAATIASGRDFFVNWADFPAMAVSSAGVRTAFWLQRSGAGKYSYDIMLTRSTDGGATWSAGRPLHQDGVAAEHGFVALWPGADGAVEAAWLDGRGTTGPDPATRAMRVVSAVVAADGRIGPEATLDLRTCDCCQVTGVMTARGPVVAYRDRTEDEVRDIAVVRREGDRWTAPRVVHPDGWRIAACPVNGPALAARGDTVVLAWFTGAQDTARVRVAYSTDAGATFGAPARVDAGRPAGRVDVELLPDGSAAVSWLERTDSTSAEVRLRRVRPDGTMGRPVLLARTLGARASGFPRMTRRGDQLVAAWTMPGDSARVQVARVAIPSLP